MSYAMNLPEWPFARKRRERKEKLASETDTEESAEPARPLPPQTPEEQRLVRMVYKHVEDSRAIREEDEGEWYTALAFMRGKQWLAWDPVQRRLKDMRDSVAGKNYKVLPQMPTLGLIATARVTASRPDVIITPLSEQELDRGATEELSAAIPYINQKNNLPKIIAQVGGYAWAATTAFNYVYWDADAEAEVPVEYDEQGTPTRYEKARVGNIKEKFVPGHDVYPEPSATDWEQVRRVVWAQEMGRDEAKERWGIKAPKQGRAQGLVSSVVRSVVEPWESTNRRRAEHSVLVLTMFEAPCAKYPEGRVIVVGDNRLLEKVTPLPAGFMPLRPLDYRTDGLQLFSRGCGLDLVGPQRDLNEMWSRWLWNIKRRPVLVSQRGVTSPDTKEAIDDVSVHERASFTEVKYPPGMNPATWQSEPYDAAGFQLSIQQAIRQLEDIAGVHAYSRGAPAESGTPAAAIRSIQDAEKEGFSGFLRNVEHFLEDRARCIAKLLAAYVREPRAWEIDDANNPGAANVSYSSLPSLRAGGLARLKVIEGSATPSTPEVMDSEILRLFELGVLGDPASPETTQTVLEALHSPGAAHVMKVKERVAKKMAAQQLQEAITEQQLEGDADPEQQALEPFDQLLARNQQNIPASVANPAGSGY